MTKKELVKIAKAGFPERVKQFIDFRKTRIHTFGDTYRLYEIGTPFDGMLPNDKYLAVTVRDEGKKKYVEISAGIRAFNVYAAIKEMERLAII